MLNFRLGSIGNLSLRAARDVSVLGAIFAKLNFQKKLSILFSFLFLVWSTSAFAERLERTDSISNVIKKFITENMQIAEGDTIEVKVNEANAPIKVATCAQPLTVDFPKNANRELVTSVELSCSGQSWHTLVPVDVQVYTKVLVSTRTLPAKENLSEEDLDFMLYNKNRLYNGYFTNKAELMGTQTARIITAGTILTKKNIQLPIVVTRNQSITLIAKNNSVSVSMQGIARTDGALNSVIKVYNPSSKRTVDAIVLGPNQAQVIA